ncbi:glutamyl-tRNA reductase [Catenuloplanes japonicus]|uniref:glutamyl-tRNA reductase n=1 Tax=Catenuloplanes japonicus TaxID=33876 RepID=UPI00052796C5|nr:glutamyl-tRNA reductase [Catenuloplanes japonicus]
MKLLVVGASYRTSPVPVLERLATAPADLPGMLQRLIAQPYVGEAVVLSTCNRVEIYAAVSGFHGGLGDICAVLAAQAGFDVPAELASHLYVHFDGDAVEHTFKVAAGLDSMVIGEPQILGQLRDAYHSATEADTAGRLLHELMQQGLRVGKRAHAETGIDRAGQSVVTAALEVAAEHLPGGLDGRPALVIGAGAMGALSVATLSRAGIGPLHVTNRNTERAARLAEAYGAHPVDYRDIAGALREADLVVTATASQSPVLTRELLADATAARAGRDPLVVLDLALPRDVAPDAAGLPGVVVLDIDRLAESRRDHPASADTIAVENIVAGEVESFLGWLRGKDVAPTVAALRGRADDVLTAELRRLNQRRPEFTDEQRADVARTLHRVVQQLLHSPTVRVRQLAQTPGGDQYAALLRELFDLDIPQATHANAVPEIGGEA